MRKKCNVCGKQAEFIFNSKVMDKYDVNYFFCKNCKLISTEKPFWLTEAYENPINKYDTGLLWRNNVFSNITVVLLFFLSKPKFFLDYAGGYGLFTRTMRDLGYDFYWYDPYCKNLFSIGFEGKMNKGYEAITAFEVFEHFVNPLSEIKKINKFTDTIIFSTELTSKNTARNKSWRYYGFKHGQHVNFYSKETLRYIAKRFGYNFYSRLNFHLFTRKKIPNFLFSLIVILGYFSLLPKIFFKRKSKTYTDHDMIVKETV